MEEHNGWKRGEKVSVDIHITGYYYLLKYILMKYDSIKFQKEVVYE